MGNGFVQPAMKFMCFLCLFVALSLAQVSSGPAKGTLILSGGDQETGLKEFVELAGGPDANIVYIPTAAWLEQGESFNLRMKTKESESVLRP